MKRVLIVGGGIAGLTSAILLEKAGYETEIVEQALKWEAVGAGIVLWPNALKVLLACGIKEDVESRGNILQKMNIIDKNGNLISGFDFSSISKNEKLYAVGIFRPELHKALVCGLKNTKVILGKTIEKLENKSDGVEAQFTGGKINNYDFVIGADGINSKTRKLVFGEAKLRFSGDSGWRFMTDCKGLENTAFEMWGKVKRFGMVPVGKDKLYCFSIIKTPGNNDKYRNISIDDYRSLYCELGWKAKEIMDSLSDDVVLIYNDIADLKLKSWHKDNAVLIGDAAHAVTPNLGSGAAMAMEDALCLTEALNRNSDLQTAFTEYFRIRYKRVNFIRNASYWLGRGRRLNNMFGKLRNIAVTGAGRVTTPYIIKKVIGI